jgi:nucleotide-binding universal stress UspA family protein
MRHVREGNWIRHNGGRASLPAFPPRRPNGLVGGLVPTAFGESKIEKRATEESGLTAALLSRYRSLLVPVDGSPFGEHALALAMAIARRAGAEVRVMHVHSSLQSTFHRGRSYYDSGPDLWLKRRQEMYLDDLVRRLAKVTSVPIIPVFREGLEVSDSLCEAASAGTDLVVMATHGRGLFGRLCFGSVGDALMHRLSVPLLFVRGYNVPADLTGDPIIRNVLITLDGSEVAEKVLEPALALGTLTAADHTLLRVIPWVTDFSLGYPPGPEASRSLTDRKRTEAWSYLRRVAKRFAGGTVRVHPRLVLAEESTVKAILHQAKAHDADLIALTTRGRGGWSRVFQRGVADRVIRGASVPVLVCRQDTMSRHDDQKEVSGVALV